MNFKKIEVFGFKSFADKLNIEFESGITAIVGPNGCGKSNVADSIRWVLGEQSAKTLRGGSMQDVIFNGTQNRKSLSYCEVSLYFDNESRMFDVDYNEVSITRKLFRSGESEYYINSKPCRLKDITDMLRQAGMARGGYSIIGQGRIDEILSSKPADRRSIFEEAIGISKYRANKVEAERKLARCKESKVRLLDRKYIFESNMGPLKKQAEAAEKYNALFDDLKNMEVNSYIYQYETANKSKDIISERLDEILHRLKEKEKEFFNANVEYENCLVAISNADKDIENLRDTQLELTIQIEKKTGETNLNKERIKFMTDENLRLEADIKFYTEKYSSLVTVLQEKMRLRDELRDKVSIDNDTYQALQEEFMQIVQKISSDDSEYQLSQAEIMQKMSKLGEIKANLSGYTAEKNTLLARNKIISNKIIDIENEIETLEKGQISFTKKLSELEKQKENEDISLQSMRENLSEKENQLKNAHRNIAQASNKLSSLETRFKLYDVMRSNMDGYIFSVKKLIQSSDGDKELSSRIEGVVAKLLTVSEQFEVALDVALGQSSQNIITTTKDNAKYLINYLKQNRFGRATFLPIEGVKPRYLSSEELKVTKEQGCFGVACDLIKYDNKYDNIYKSLLGKTVIVDNLDTAISISRKYSLTYKIVTLEGDVIAPSGAMTGGSKKSDTVSVLSYDRDIKDVEQQINVVNQDIANFKSVRRVLEQDILSLSSNTKNSQQLLHNLDLDIIKNIEERSKLSIQINELNDHKDELVAENIQINTRLQDINDSYVEYDKLENLLSKQNSNVSDEMKKRFESSDKLKKHRDELNEKITSLKVSIAEDNTKVMALIEEIKRLNAEVVGINENITKSTEHIKSNNEIISEYKSEIDNAISQHSDDNRISDIKDKLQNLDSYKSDLNTRLADCDARKTTVNNDVAMITELKHKEDMALEKVDIDIQVMQDRVSDEYNLDYTSALSYKNEEFDFENSQKEINKLRRQIQNLGPINHNAIDDYKSQSAEYEENEIHLADIEKSEKDILGIISETVDKMLEQFNSGFDKINSNFTVVFKELFGGGNANLVLEPSENGDSLDDGIEIVAEPPGKKLQSISLLSGGERALTAIAILFAILMLRPMPFCVLDEIEAALDDANADRFARYLHKFSKNTQFIVITHRKPTMELADALYGVTMEEKGVSKMVSVKLGEALARYDIAAAK